MFWTSVEAELCEKFGRRFHAAVAKLWPDGYPNRSVQYFLRSQCGGGLRGAAPDPKGGLPGAGPGALLGRAAGRVGSAGRLGRGADENSELPGPSTSNTFGALSSTQINRSVSQVSLKYLGKFPALNEGT